MAIHGSWSSSSRWWVLPWSQRPTPCGDGPRRSRRWSSSHASGSLSTRCSSSRSRRRWPSSAEFREPRVGADLTLVAGRAVARRGWEIGPACLSRVLLGLLLCATLAEPALTIELCHRGLPLGVRGHGGPVLSVWKIERRRDARSRRWRAAFAARPQMTLLERGDVDGLGALVPGLGVEGDLRALRQRLEAVGVDAGVMDEEVLAALVGRDEAEALVVVEPLDGSGSHCVSPTYVDCERGRRCTATTAGAEHDVRRARCPTPYEDHSTDVRRSM